MCKNDTSYSLTGLDIVLPMEVNGELVDVEMDLYAKTVIIDGLPYLGYYVIPTGDSIIEHEPTAIDLSTHLFYTHKIETKFVKTESGYEQVIAYTIYRNNKEFCSGEAKDLQTCENMIKQNLTKLQSTRLVDFRMKDFRERLVGNNFNINNVSVKVLEYIEGKNMIKVINTKGDAEVELPAWVVNE